MAYPDDARTLWDAALALNRAAGDVRTAATGRDNPVPRDLPPLLFFTDPDRTPEPWRTAAALPAGACVVYRHFGRPDAAETARRLRDVTSARGVRLLIGLDVALAATIGADGVHLPERALGQALSIRAAHPGWLVTGAIHAAAAAVHSGDALDALILSPIFKAGGASARTPALGVDALRAAAIGRPIYALGGITARNVGELARSGACGVAGVEAIATAFKSPVAPSD